MVSIAQSNLPLTPPPAAKHGSAASELAAYFAPTTPWTGAWYHSTTAAAVPPPLVGKNDHRFRISWRSFKNDKTTYVGVLFADLSIFWGSVKFDMTQPEDPSTTQRRAVFLPPPKALGKEQLVEAHQTYGETIALFAESFLGSGQYCARGECWDLASEALKYFKDYDYIPTPVPSISRMHGHLIFEANASNGGRDVVGQWHGGDDRVRRGDIIQWRRARVSMKKGRYAGGYSTLGDPDHTAVIVSDAIPSLSPRDGASLNPSDLGEIVVVEQSVGNPPSRQEYDLSGFEEGEVWIYRPIGMQVYLGISDITAEPPEGLQGLQSL